MPIYTKTHITETLTGNIATEFGTPAELKAVIWGAGELYVEQVISGKLTSRQLIDALGIPVNKFKLVISIYSHYLNLDIPAELFDDSAQALLCIVYISSEVSK